MKNKKASTPLSVTIVFLFVILTLFSSLYSFLMIEHNFQAKMDYSSIKMISNIYGKANILNFYLDEISSKANKPNLIESFKDNFNDFEETYNKANENKEFIDFQQEFKQIKEQIDNDHLKIIDNKIKIYFLINISDSSESIKRLNYEDYSTFEEK